MVLNKRQSLLVYKILRESGYGNCYFEFNNGHILDRESKIYHTYQEQIKKEK